LGEPFGAPTRKVNMKVTIIGKGRGWEYAPYSGETWGITQIFLRRPVSMVIDMNVYDDMRWGEEEANEAKFCRKLCEVHNIPYIDLKSYPINDIKFFFCTDYFTNTVDYALALAIYRGYTEIDLYGVNMEHESEYGYQKAGCEFWIGQAMGRGVTVNIHGENSALLRARDGVMYGYDTPQMLLR
jgi:hypothetical protein